MYRPRIYLYTPGEPAQAQVFFYATGPEAASFKAPLLFDQAATILGNKESEKKLEEKAKPAAEDP